jgi:3-phenylpropionate/cinnamic acid dioxygenase small subunit
MTGDEIREIEAFLFLEARLADESRYDDWEALVDQDMVYWVPVGEGDYDPEERVSIIYDNRTRLASRIRQLNTGVRYAQTPPSPMRRLLSNIEIRKPAEDEYITFSNFILLELQVQATHNFCIWGGRVEHRIRRGANGLRMFFKKVSLVNSTEPLPTMGFLI